MRWREIQFVRKVFAGMLLKEKLCFAEVNRRDLVRDAGERYAETLCALHGPPLQE